MVGPSQPIAKFKNKFPGGSFPVAKGSGKVRNWSKEVSRGKVLRLHTVFGVLTQSEDLVSSLHSIYSTEWLTNRTNE